MAPRAETLEQFKAAMEAGGEDLVDGKLDPNELFWRDHQPWLKEQGYSLRPRYQPDWVASWKTDPQKDWMYCEDSLVASFSHVLDAIRDDGTAVALKRIQPSKHPEEVAIGQLFSTEPLARHPKNHCIPILDVLQVPNDDDAVIIVMPFYYPWSRVPFQTIGETVEFFRQIFEGLSFMHQNCVSHRDCKDNNVMADLLPLYKSPPHPQNQRKTRDLRANVKIQTSRTRTPVKYFWVDFGLSRQYKPENAPHLERGGWGGDKSVPEFQARDHSLCDPFAVDIYCIGNIIQRNFLQGEAGFAKAKKGFGFMRELVADMVSENPKARPTMEQVVARFDTIVKGLNTWKLRSRVADVDEPPIRGMARSLVHWTTQLGFMAKSIDPIPKA